MNSLKEKQLAAEKAVDFIEDGMIIGLGTGSTVSFMIKKLAERIKSRLRITAVSTSTNTTKLAISLGIKVFNIDEVKEIDLTIDGADEVDENFNGIKGGGGALLFEKIVASVSKKNVWIVDSSKLVKTLGKFPLPVEIVQYGAEHTFSELKKRELNPIFRTTNNKKFVTDGNHYLIDLNPGPIENPVKLNRELNEIPGVVETGLFCNVVDVVVAGIGESVKIIEQKKERSNLSQI